MEIFKAFILFSLCFCTQQTSDVIYPVVNYDQELATSINCRVGEVRHFKYNSITSFWESIDGKIAVTADLSLTCTGNDTGGAYGEGGLKFQGWITSLTISQNGKAEEFNLRREKRGIGDFFSNAWTKVKKFFKGLFGGAPETESRSSPNPETEDRSPSFPPPDDKKVEEEESEEDEPDDYMYNDLYKEPFKFVQMANGSVPMVWFTGKDTDSRIRNFKRHLVDTFASQFSMKPYHSTVVENTVMGEHLSNYNITLTSFTAAYSSELETENPEFQNDGSNMVTIDKIITQEDILKFAPDSEISAVNDVNKMELKARQTQIFKEGKLLSTSGSTSLSLFDIDSGRKKREVDDIMGYFKVHTDYELQLARIQKRSADNDLSGALEDSDFSAAGRTAELEEISIRQRLQDLQKSIGDVGLFVQNLMTEVKENGGDEKLQIILEVVEQEVRFGVDQEPQSITKEVRNVLTKEVLDDFCFAKRKSCTDLLQLLARAGGSQAENILISFLKDDNTEVENRKDVADIISDLSNPSPEVINELIEMLTSNSTSSLDRRLLGPVAIGTSNLVIAANDLQKRTLMEALVLILDQSWSTDESESNSLTLDVLEAIGNVGDVQALSKVLEVCNAAVQNEVKISCTHAMRFMSNLTDVQSWMARKISTSTCDVSQAIIGSLLDKIHAQEMTKDEIYWPRVGFNKVDRILKKYVETNPPHFECAISDALRYFGRKKDNEAHEIATNFFNSDSEPYEPGSNSRQRRDLWDDLNCNEWTESDKYTPILNKDEFFDDRATYNKRKSCLAYRRLGLKGANTDVYAGMFAGVREPSVPPKYKIFSKFVNSVNFLGQSTEIGSFNFYHKSGNTKSYIRIMGKTRQEFRHEGCTPSDIRYHPITHIPLYQVQVSVVQLSLGIHLSSELMLETQCPGYDKYALKPMTNVRIGGEAMGTILFARAAMNLGGNFNYHLNFMFSPVPDMCLRGQHGYDPMSISVEAYYQLWNVRKLRWGKHNIWKPDILAWEITGANRRPWFNDTCVLDDKEGSSSTTTSTSSPDAQGTPIVPQSDDENAVFVVRA